LLKPVGQPADEPGRSWAEYAEPENLDVPGSGIVAGVVDDWIDPRAYGNKSVVEWLV
jgi:hypothetical protein